MSKVQTREEAYGIAGKPLAARSRRKLNAIRRLLDEIDAPWADVDHSVQMAADELRSACDEFEKSLEHAVEYLKAEVGT